MTNMPAIVTLSRNVKKMYFFFHVNIFVTIITHNSQQANEKGEKVAAVFIEVLKLVLNALAQRLLKSTPILSAFRT